MPRASRLGERALLRAMVERDPGDQRGDDQRGHA